MLEMLLLLLLVIFLTSLSGFWLGYFLGKTVTFKQLSDKLDTIIEQTLTDHYNVKDSDIVKNLTEIIHEITVDKTPQIGYNDLNNQPKHKDVSSETSERILE